MGRAMSLYGVRSGKLTVVERVANDGRRARWLCRCDCGNTVEVLAQNLISRDGKQGDPTYTNVPKTPVEFLKLVVAPGKPWQETQVTIPGSAFPDKEKNYVILLQSAKLGGPVGENLFTGSAIIAGTADVGIVKTRP